MKTLPSDLRQSDLPLWFPRTSFELCASWLNTSEHSTGIDVGETALNSIWEGSRRFDKVDGQIHCGIGDYIFKRDDVVLYAC